MTGTSASLRTQRAVESLHSGPQQAVRYHATAGGWYDVEVQATARHAGAYTLRIAKTS